MELRLTDGDFARLNPETLAQLLRELGLNPFASPSPRPGPGGGSPSASQEAWAEEWDFRNVADLTVPQVREFVRGYEHLERALRVFAEHGPILDAKLLSGAGVVDDPTGEEKGWDGVIAISTFQRAVTKRTRTVTGNKTAFLFTWGEWNHDNDGRLLSGEYVISPVTYHALRKYFGVED